MEGSMILVIGAGNWAVLIVDRVKELVMATFLFLLITDREAVV